MSRLLLLLACSTSLMGCIFRDFDYEPPPNVAPSVHGSPETPLDRVYVVDLDVEPGGDAGLGSDVNFVAIVRDANIAQPLEALIFLDRSDLDPRADANPRAIAVEQDDTPRERRFPFSIPRASITPAGRCHSVELHVATGFTDLVTAPRPVDEREFAVGVWWIAAIDSGMATTTVDMTTCPTLPL